MAKITKKQYTRKVLFAGAAIFLSAVLIITGVAIWLLFSALSTSAGGGVTVGEVATSPLSFSALMIDGEDVVDGEAKGAGFIFDAQVGDDYGRVTYGNSGKSGEKLSINVAGVIVNAQQLAKFSYTLEMPQGVKDAAAKGYVDISDFYDAQTGKVKEVAVSLSQDGVMVSENGVTVWRFNFSITIKWGYMFNYTNPGVYYDEDEQGLKVPDETVTETLKDMYQTIMGDTHVKPRYNLTLIASPNS